MLRTAGVVTLDKTKAAMEEFTSYLVEKQRQHEGSDQLANENVDIVDYLVRVFSFQSRHHLHVFKICCLVIGRSHKDLPALKLDLSEMGLNCTVVQNCLRLL